MLGSRGGGEEDGLSIDKQPSQATHKEHRVQRPRGGHVCRPPNVPKRSAFLRQNRPSTVTLVLTSVRVRCIPGSKNRANAAKFAGVDKETERVEYDDESKHEGAEREAGTVEEASNGLRGHPGNLG